MNHVTAAQMGYAPAQERTTAAQKILTVIGMILCAVLLPILVVNCVLIWRAYTNPSSVPRFGGVVPLVVQTDVMYPEIQSGDLIICRSVKPESLREGDIITFINSATNQGISIGVNRVAEVENRDGVPVLTVNEKKEDGEVADREISVESLIGVYRKRFRGLGKLILFMKTTQGLILCVMLPILLLVGYDVVRTRIDERQSREEAARLAAELETLREAQYGQRPRE